MIDIMQGSMPNNEHLFTYYKGIIIFLNWFLFENYSTSLVENIYEK